MPGEAGYHLASECRDMEERTVRQPLVALLVLLALLLAACGEATDQGETGAPATDGGGDGDGEGITLNFVTLDDPNQLTALAEMSEAFAASDPQWANVTVNFDSVPFEQLFPKIEASVAAGADFDAFLADGPDIKHYAFNEALIPLQEFYTAEELEEWVPASVEEGS
jgi:ABC-type glycerol-3-phosphate transport system substrate-binding protein